MLTADIFSSGKGMERTATFVGNVAFEENDQVRLGMSVVVYTQDDLADAPATKDE